ncbi:MAG: DUF4189 domain-containing protein [Desulfobulbaceae bacterium]|nr:DUF4189 domain-containing protein [Desulfobulbaceae bacterium]
MTILKSLLLALSATFFLAATGFAQGSLAIDSNQGDQYGFSYNYPGVSEADQKARSECGSGCSIVLRFSNECAAYAADQSSGSTAYGWGTSSSSSSAKNRALSECRNRGGSQCRVRVWGCDN